MRSVRSPVSHKSNGSCSWGISSIQDDSKIDSDAGGSNPDINSDRDQREENFAKDDKEIDPLFADRFREEKKQKQEDLSNFLEKRYLQGI